MNDLIEEYQKSLRITRSLKPTANDSDRGHLGSMERDLLYSLDWMKTTRRPGNRRGVERLASYQRERPVDPILMQKYCRSSELDPYHLIDQPKSDEITPSDKKRIDDALYILTEREKEMYIMSRGQCLSYSQISFYLNVSKSTVQATIERAENKLANSLFSTCG